MYCKYCNKPLNESQFSEDQQFKSCPRCSALNGEEHIYCTYPQEFGTTAKRESGNHPDGPQSYCTRHRVNKNKDTQYGGILCSELGRH